MFDLQCNTVSLSGPCRLPGAAPRARSRHYGGSLPVERLALSAYHHPREATRGAGGGPQFGPGVRSSVFKLLRPV